MTGNKLVGFSILSFLASIAGIIVSFLLLKEDVLSTAKTLFEFFPTKYGVIPSATWSGAIILGLFTSILQIVSASIALSPRYGTWARILATISLIASAWFDNWTDVVFRSGYLTGDTKIATISTLAFYTFGSEITQSLSWIVFLNIWRTAISDIMWGWAKLGAGFSSIQSEWKKFQSAAKRSEDKERGSGEQSTIKPAQSYQPTVRPADSIHKPNFNNIQKQYPTQHKVNMQGGRPEPTYHPVGSDK
jgi:hypothetical protein